MLSFIKKPEVIIWILILITLIISKFAVGLKYLSVYSIIKNHFNCFRGEEDGKIKLLPVLNYFIVPMLLGASAAYVKEIDKDVIDIITVIVSILTAMFFTLLTIVIDMKSKIRANPKYYSTEAKISKRALVETYYAIMFEVLVSVVLLILCFLNIFTNIFSFIQSFLIYGLLFLLVVNLLMIIKRISRVIDADINK